ncbi:MAG: hypothetical protein ABIF11_05190 [Nitrospirota bacterium]
MNKKITKPVKRVRKKTKRITNTNTGLPSDKDAHDTKKKVFSGEIMNKGVI